MSIPVRYVEVTAGHGHNSNEDSPSKKGGVFMNKRSIIVREDELSALFRRDWELCSMPIIKIRNTNQRPVNELPVRY